ncbi:hypothetical protein HYV82_00405 [Candidatus Woesearchaeota archaeon]|nr:hypothetical protein [Candidatus Woesearchaeota archaeon]
METESFGAFCIMATGRSALGIAGQDVPYCSLLAVPLQQGVYEEPGAFPLREQLRREGCPYLSPELSNIVIAMHSAAYKGVGLNEGALVSAPLCRNLELLRAYGQP